MNRNTGVKRTRQKSVIISALDSVADKIYSALRNGFFGRIFTSYTGNVGTIAAKVTGKSAFSDKLDSARRTVAKTIEGSLAAKLYTWLVHYLLSCRVKVYGTVFETFFIYSAVVQVYSFYKSGFSGIPFDLISTLLAAIAVLPLLTSNLPLFTLLAKSPVGRRVLAVTGNRCEGADAYTARGRCNIGFVVGTVLGLATYFIPADLMIKLAIRGIWAMLVFHSPEFGIVSLAFMMPFDKTMMLVAETAIVILSFALKLILGKRTIKLEAVDIAALLFAVMMLIGGVFSMSRASLKPMLVYLCFMAVYFLIVCLIRTGEWLSRCVISAVASGTAVAAYGIFQYLTGRIGFSTKWLDSEMFEDISGRAISTLENPNMLGEYLVMIIPMAAALMLCSETLRRRAMYFLAFGCLGCCLIVTWSRGAWLGMMFAALVFCLIWSKRCLHLFWVLVLSIPFLPIILPQNILLRFASIGNVADTSTSYRLNIWLGTMKMLPSRILSGIGIGEGAWKLVYPHYALTGVSEAPHSHSLYFQIWVEMGFVALVIFVIFLGMMFASNFSMYAKLSDAGDSLISRITPAPLKDAPASERRISPEEYEDRRLRRSRNSFRLMAAAPLCGISGVLVQGFTDYMWYNYRVYLMFWICLGLTAAFARFGRERIAAGESLMDDDSSTAVADITLAKSREKAGQECAGEEGRV